jgi:hypothetical protein
MNYLNLSISYEDHVSPWLRSAIARLANRQGLHAAMGAAVEVTVEDQLARKASVPNKLGAPSTGYWMKARSSVRTTSDDTGATVSIPYRGVRLHYYGGTVVPVNKKWLTIPARAEAHGKRVEELFPGYSGCKWLFNAARQPYAIAGKEDGLVYFWLAKKAVIPADPTVLPPVQSMAAAAVTAAERFVAREVTP